MNTAKYPYSKVIDYDILEQEKSEFPIEKQLFTRLKGQTQSSIVKLTQKQLSRMESMTNKWEHDIWYTKE